MAKLPELPKGKEFEEYVSALFQCGGFYVERNLIEKEESGLVLELDIVASSYAIDQFRNLVVEVKTGEWGFPDIFKVKGWLDYLGYSEGALISNTQKENYDFYDSKTQEIGIKVIQINDLSTAQLMLRDVIPDCQFSEDDFNTWRFSYWVERSLLFDLKRCKRQFLGLNKKSYEELDKYYFLLNSGVFFTKSIVLRVHKLYETFKKYPKISAKCGNELINRPFDEEVDKLPENIYRASFYDCEYNVIQLSTFIEHRARLALLKSAIDYLIAKKGKVEADKSGFGQKYEDALLDLLPMSFKNGMQQLETHQYFYRYPIFWQWFMWVLGGFILKDYEESEYLILSQKSGIPIDEISRAFDSYQILFPQQDGWFLDLSQSNIRLMKMFPLPFSGVGANYRRLIYTTTKKYEDLKLSGMHTSNDLYKWNNLTVRVLENRT